MNDLIKEIVKGIAAGLSIETGKELIKNEKAREFLSQIYGVSKEKIEEFIIDNSKYINTRRLGIVFSKLYEQTQQLENVTLKKIRDKILYTSVEYISLNDDIEDCQILQDKWVNLLLAEIETGKVDPFYLTILRDLTVLDAKVLDKFFKSESGWNIREAIVADLESDNIKDFKIQASINKLISYNFVAVSEVFIGYGESGKVTLTSLGKDFMETVSCKHIPKSSS